MDTNARDVLIALITVAGGLTTAIVVARITVGATRGLERTKWKRELYASFIHSTNEIRDAIRLVVTSDEPDPRWADHAERAQRYLLEIKMIAPSMGNAADGVWSAVTSLMFGVGRFASATATPAGIAVPLDLSHYPALDEAYRVAMLAFVDRASRELR